MITIHSKHCYIPLRGIRVYNTVYQTEWTQTGLFSSLAVMCAHSGPV